MATSIVTSDTFVRLKRSVQSALGLIPKIAVFLSIALVGGLLSSWYVVSNGAAFNTERQGAWVRWTMGAHTEADPYSVVRYNRHQALVFSSTFVSRYEATFDDGDRRLHSACHYAIEGRPPAGEWWSLNVYDANGWLIPNESNRHGFNAAERAGIPYLRLERAAWAPLPADN